MKLETRSAIWGIEIKNDTVIGEIYNASTEELRGDSINFLEVVKDLVNTVNHTEDYKDSVISHIENAINRLEDI